jgi:Zn finger protein HypA/HybF involved in hydrogenase expression
MNQVKISEFASLLSSRTAAQTVTVTPVDFEDEAECETCGFEGLMEFFENGFEEAVAECPKCGDRVEKYIGADVD